MRSSWLDYPSGDRISWQLSVEQRSQGRRDRQYEGWGGDHSAWLQPKEAKEYWSQPGTGYGGGLFPEHLEHERIHVCGLKPPSLWHLDTAAIGDTYMHKTVLPGNPNYPLVCLPSAGIRSVHCRVSLVLMGLGH